MRKINKNQQEDLQKVLLLEQLELLVRLQLLRWD
jgi:hypothetical protein